MLGVWGVDHSRQLLASVVLIVDFVGHILQVLHVRPAWEACFVTSHFTNLRIYSLTLDSFGLY